MKRTTTNILMATLLMATTACSIHVREKDEDDADDSGTVIVDPTYPDDPDYVPVPVPVERRGQECVSADSTWYTTQYGSYFRQSSYQCFENDDYKWRTSCPSADCSSVQVFVHYMLPEDIGDGLTVTVEAFDNQQFSGYPKGTVTIQDFDAELGKYDSADLYLEPGEYYLRAFVTNQDSAPTPYPMGDMELVAGEPMGFYGALSGAQKIMVSPQVAPEPVHIKLDKLFQKPGSEPDTRAHVRTVITTELYAEIATGRKVYIELFSDEDFERTPDYQFAMVSELLKVEGEQGRAEFVSPSLAVGDYFVRIYIDDNGNEFYDAEELAGIHSAGGLPRYVRIQENTVRSVSIDLTRDSL